MASQATASLPTTLRSPPSVEAYTPLEEHQSRTPASFFDGPAVLYYHRTGARAYLSTENRDKLPWGGSATEATTGASWPVMVDDMVEQVVDVFVGSDTLVLYSPAASCGVALPYPVIGLHAIKSAYTADNRRVPTIYMQLELSGASGNEDDEPETVELTLVPAGAAEAAAEEATSSAVVSEASKLFDAISACADLHPDRFGGDDDDDDGYPSFFRNGANGDNGDEHEDGDYGEEYGEEEEDGILVEGGDDASLEPIEGFRGVFRGDHSAHGGAGAAAAVSGASATSGLPPPMPGSGGWITAENAHEFFDEDGNWRGRGGSLGEGAGRVRDRDEVEAGDDAAGGRASAAEGAASSGESAAAGGAGLNTNGHSGADVGDGTESKRPRTE